jgi:uncharacterized membrane protein YqjE
MMSTPSYRLTVVACALSWFLVGLHAPIVHEVTHHGRIPRWSVLAVVALLVLAAVAALWALLRTPRPRADSGAAAT